MRRTPLLIPLTLLVALGGTAESAVAKGQTDKVVISGPGIDGHVAVTERRLLRGLALGELESMEHTRPTAPSVRGTAEDYRLVRYLRDSSGRLVPTDRVRYYPPLGGAPGYVFNEGLPGSRGWWEHRWHTSRPSGDQAMRRLFARLGVYAKRQQADGGAPTWPVAAIAILALGSGCAWCLWTRG